MGTAGKGEQGGWSGVRGGKDVVESECREIRGPGHDGHCQDLVAL